MTLRSGFGSYLPNSWNYRKREKVQHNESVALLCVITSNLRVDLTLAKGRLKLL